MDWLSLIGWWCALSVVAAVLFGALVKGGQ